MSKKTRTILQGNCDEKLFYPDMLEIRITNEFLNTKQWRNFPETERKNRYYANFIRTIAYGSSLSLPFATV